MPTGVIVLLKVTNFYLVLKLESCLCNGQDESVMNEKRLDHFFWDKFFDFFLWNRTYYYLVEFRGEAAR